MNSRYRFAKLDAGTLTAAQFGQMVEIEETCGLAPYPPDMLRACISEMDTFACFDGDRILGFITVHDSARYFCGGLYLVNINVARAYRGQGIAKRLMYAAYQAYLPTHAGKLITLDVEKDSKAVALYRKVGFQPADIPSRNGPSDMVMVMALEELGPNIEKIFTGATAVMPRK